MSEFNPLTQYAEVLIHAMYVKDSETEDEYNEHIPILVTIGESEITASFGHSVFRSDINFAVTDSDVHFPRVLIFHVLLAMDVLAKVRLDKIRLVDVESKIKEKRSKNG